MLHTHLTGVGAYLPQRVVTNDELAMRVDTSDAWIRERTGIRERRMAAEGERTSDLALAAARRALSVAGVAVEQLDALVVATTTPDLIFPSTAAIVQAKLGGGGFPVWDLQAVCAGFVYGLAQLDAMMRAGMFRRALLIGAETMSRILNWDDRSTCVLFGDGAGAVVLEARPEEGGVIGSVLHGDGAHRDLLKAQYGRVEQSDRPDFHTDAAGVAAIEMRGNEVFRIAVKSLGAVVGEVLSLHGLGEEDVDWLVPHQANLRIIRAIARRLRLPEERVAVTVDRHANTSAASVPLALDHLYRRGRLLPGQLLLLESFGAGFVWGANLLRWGIPPAA
ncbi:MAG: ketoacyl-ACP synthase III [Zetaproteobacteria bacterium]|nr:MAG: ketoacyl-ACP synthase III [Zetaproteobacteria bacterium]